MDKQKTGKQCKTISIILVILALIFVVWGFYKKEVYGNGEYYPYEVKNAYVGGDAYNYIINGTYFTGLLALGGALCVSSSIFAVAGYVLTMSDPEEAAPKDTQKLSADIDGDLPHESQGES